MRRVIGTGRDILKLLERAVASWSEDNAFRLAAALAYYACFSLAPLLIIAIAIAGSVLGPKAAQGEVIGQIQALIGSRGALAIQMMLENANKPGAKLTASALGIVSLVFGATGVFVSLQDGLNTVWQVKQKPQNFIVGFIRNRIHTFTMVLGIAFLLLVSLVISAAIAAVGTFFDDQYGVTIIWQGINSLVSFAIVSVLFAMIFKYLPDVYIRWRDVIMGSVITAALFTAGKLAIGAYIGRGSFTSVYGATGSLVVILAWVYYSSLILFLGAEFTRVYADRYGKRIVPKPNAMPLTPDMRAEQGMQPHTQAKKPAA